MKKNKKKAKVKKTKASKKGISPKPQKRPNSTALAVVSVQDLIKPEVEGGKYSMVKSPIKQAQILRMLAKTPPQYIKTRPAKGGGTWKYVPGWYMKKVLNYVFGWLWNFEVVAHGTNGDFIWVQGKLTILDPRTLQPTIIKTQFGGAEIKFKKGTKTFLDFPNDLKAATTDALKKCAAELGIASDVYGTNEYVETGYSEAQPEVQPSPSPAPAAPTQPQPTGTIDYKKALDNLLVRLGGKTNIEKLKLIGKFTLLKYNDYDAIAPSNAKSIFEQIKRKVSQ